MTQDEIKELAKKVFVGLIYRKDGSGTGRGLADSAIKYAKTFALELEVAFPPKPPAK